MRAWLTLAVVVMLGACGGAPAPPPVAPKLPAVDERKAEKDAKGLLTEIYQSIGHGDTDGLMSLLAEPLVVFGPRKNDALGTRADALVALKEKVESEIETKARAAIERAHGRRIARRSLRVGGRRDDDQRRATRDHVRAVEHRRSVERQRRDARTYAADETGPRRAQARRGRADGMAGVAKLDPGARGAADKLSKGLNEQKIWFDDLATRSDSVVIGPALGDITRGKKDIKKMWEHRDRRTFARRSSAMSPRLRPSMASSRGRALRSCGSKTMTTRSRCESSPCSSAIKPTGR